MNQNAFSDRFFFSKGSAKDASSLCPDLNIASLPDWISTSQSDLHLQVSSAVYRIEDSGKCPVAHESSTVRGSLFQQSGSTVFGKVASLDPRRCRRGTARRHYAIKVVRPYDSIRRPIREILLPPSSLGPSCELSPRGADGRCFHKPSLILIVG